MGFGTAVDRRYTPYGDAEPRAIDSATSLPFKADMIPADVTMDGTANIADFTLISAFGSPKSYGQGDVNGDGVTNLSDFNIFSGNYGKTWTARTVDQLFADTTAANGCLVGYCGYLREPITGLYHVRHRWYDPKAGRWLTRDPSLPRV